LLLVLVPFPNSPLLLSPQASTCPVEVTAKLCWVPAAIAVTVVPTGNEVDIGTLLLVLVPFPNSPLLLSPQASTCPVEVRAKLWSPPAAIAVTVVPTGNDTDTGTLLVVLDPFPN
jgi:hypothetical protein